MNTDPFQIVITARQKDSLPVLYGWSCLLCMNHVVRDDDPDRAHGAALAHLVIYHNIYAGLIKPSIIKEA